ncbi:MAG TPA: hypothetical protein VH879_09340 [Gemmatimonadales bacterium]|jgi:DNA-directed RNA polymerase specialized sigma24 family protein
MREDTDIGGPARAFPATRLSLIVAAGGPDEAARRHAFETLIAVYWKPLYGRLRIRWQIDSEEAKDLTQEFFSAAMERGFFDGYDPGRARFRTFLKVCLDHFAANARRAANRVKRGGGATILPLDFAGADHEFARTGNVAEVDAEAHFRQELARALLGLAVDALRAQCETENLALRFRLFEQYDLDPAGGPERPSYKALAALHGLPVTQVTNHLAWARREFRRHVLAALRSLTGSEEEFRLEVRELLGVDPP